MNGEILTGRGIRFADATVQRTAALISTVVHDETLTGDGTSAKPLGVAIPLELDMTTGSPRVPALIVNALIDAGIGADINGGNGVNVGGSGLRVSGGNGDRIEGGFGVGASGGNSDAGALGGYGVSGTGGRGVSGGIGVVAKGGYSTGGFRVGGTGIRALAGASDSGGGTLTGLAGHFFGSVVIQTVSGSNGNLFVGSNLDVSGIKRFKIDHPLDPENKYLYHAAIESAEILNVYSGNVTTDENGEAVVQLPDWFEAINKDFRYQLTAIGSLCQPFFASKISGNRFTIKSSAAKCEVSWQVTGVRSDPVMVKHPFKAEEDKPESERGHYLNPNAYDQPKERGVEWARNPEFMRQIEEALSTHQKKSDNKSGDE